MPGTPCHRREAVGSLEAWRLVPHHQLAAKRPHELRCHLRVHEVKQRRVLHTRLRLRSVEVSLRPRVLIQPIVHAAKLRAEAQRRHRYRDADGEVAVSEGLL